MWDRQEWKGVASGEEKKVWRVEKDWVMMEARRVAVIAAPPTHTCDTVQ
jgi:hypothetical protein